MSECQRAWSTRWLHTSASARRLHAPSPPLGVVSSRWPTSCPSIAAAFYLLARSSQHLAGIPPLSGQSYPTIFPRPGDSQLDGSFRLFLSLHLLYVRLLPLIVAMSDEVKSTTSKPRKPRPRILVVNNPSPSDEEDTYPSNSASMSNPSLSDRAHSSATQYIAPLTTNLPEVSRPYPSSRSNPSNPALSSPSSTSSRAFESTPPPSTPGQSNHPEELCNEGTLRQDLVDGSETITPPSATSRPPGMLSRLRFNRPGHARRTSNNSARPAPVCHGSVSVAVGYILMFLQSPTTSIPESYSSQTSGVSGSRSSPLERVTLLVTTDAEHLVTVDVTGANDAAFIRERIFTKVCL